MTNMQDEQVPAQEEDRHRHGRCLCPQVTAFSPKIPNRPFSGPPKIPIKRCYPNFVNFPLLILLNCILVQEL